MRYQVGRRHVSTLMKKLGIEALYRHPNTPRKHPENPNLPLPAAWPGDHQGEPGWAVDITPDSGYLCRCQSNSLPSIQAGDESEQCETANSRRLDAHP